MIERDVCYLVLCEKNFSKRSAFSFLEDIAAEFNRLYGRQVSTVSRPYTLIEFGKLFKYLHNIVIFAISHTVILQKLNYKTMTNTYDYFR